MQMGHSDTHDKLESLNIQDDSDLDSLTESLEKVGVISFPKFSLPKLPSIPDSKSYYSAKDDLGAIINNKTVAIKNLCQGLSESLTGIVNSTIDYPVEDFIETGGHQNDTSIKVDKIKKTTTDKVEALLTNYNHLTYLTFEQFQDQTFLRNRIKEILNLELSPINQRFLIQQLMSRSYHERLKHQQEQVSKSNADDEDDDDDDDLEYEDDEVILTQKDKEPTYYSIEENILGCQHYQRNCKIECLTCHQWHTCRFCHNAQNPSHQLDRKNTRHILCMFCNTPQHPQQYCIECDRELSKYYCSKCKFFDNDKLKNIYHCDKCGICRLGLGLNQDYFHCDQCNACIAIELRANHVCIENATRSNCPICDEFMFNSSEKVVFMVCGHPIHETCYRKHTLHSYKCPVCSRTIVNMELQFRVRDAEVRNSIMPEEMRHWKSVIKCVDCGGKSLVPYHYLGLKCDHCRSYNTMQMKVLKGENGDEDVDIENDTDIDVEASSNGFIKNSLNQNFEFAEIKQHEKMDKKSSSALELDDIDNDYVDNFVRVINNFEAYPSLSDAFKDWIGTSLSGDDIHNN